MRRKTARTELTSRDMEPKPGEDAEEVGKNWTTGTVREAVQGIRGDKSDDHNDTKTQLQTSRRISSKRNQEAPDATQGNAERDSKRRKTTSGAVTTRAPRTTGTRGKKGCQPGGTTYFRKSISRKSKEKAAQHIQKLQLTEPEDQLRLPGVKDCEGVMVTTARSRVPTVVGRGLFLLYGPEEDGSALPGTRVATYEGRSFITCEEQAMALSTTYKSDYVWEGINPFTGKRIIVDGAAKTSYGPFMNDGLSFKEANSEIRVGEDGILYVELTTIVERNEELIMSYGCPFWMDPDRWATLNREAQLAIMAYYKCQPPTEQTNGNCRKAESNREANEDRSADADIRTNHLSQHDTLSIQRVTEPRQDPQHSFNGVFGTSQDGLTRISLQSMDEQSTNYRRIWDRMKTVEKAQAPIIFREILDSSPDILLHYWKKADKTLYKMSPTDGACGWHTIAQIMNKESTNTFLNLYDPRDIRQASSLLEKIAVSNQELDMGTREALMHAIDWMKKKSKNMRSQMNSNEELCSDHFTSYLRNIPATLFIQPSLAVAGAAPVMPHDPGREWLILHSTTQVNNLDPENYFDAFPKIIIDLISKGEFFTQLSGAHYFLFPDLPSEAGQLRTALEDHAYQIWDAVAGHQTTKTMIATPTVTAQHTSKDQTSKKQPDKLTDTRDFVGATQQPSCRRVIPEEQWRRLRHCYGTDGSQTRITLGTISPEQRELIESLAMLDAEEFQQVLWERWSTTSDFKFRYWKPINHTLWNRSPGDGACGYYTVAHLINREEGSPALNFGKQCDRVRASRMLERQLNLIEIAQDIQVAAIHAVEQIRSPTSMLPAQYQLHSQDFRTLLPNLTTALFIEPPKPELSAGMQEGNWIQLWHHTIPGLGRPDLSTSELLTLAASGNYAQYSRNHYWPYPKLQHEYARCYSALMDLIRMIWKTIRDQQHQQFMRIRENTQTQVIEDCPRAAAEMRGSSREPQDHQRRDGEEDYNMEGAEEKTEEPTTNAVNDREWVADPSDERITVAEVERARSKEPQLHKEATDKAREDNREAATSESEELDDPTAVFALQKHLFSY